MPENNTDIKKAIEWLRQVENAKQAYAKHYIRI